MNTAIIILFFALVIIDLMYAIATKANIARKRPDLSRQVSTMYPLFAPIELILLPARIDLSPKELRAIQLHLVMLVGIVIFVVYFVITGQAKA